MAEGTRLWDLSDYIHSLEEKYQKLGAEHQSKMEELTHQIAEVREIGQKQYDALRVEATRRHEELLKLLLVQQSTIHIQG